jgi:hypothetical protein
VPCRMNCVVARTFVPTMSDELAIDVSTFFSFSFSS